MSRSTIVLSILTGALCFGCAPADVAGSYSINVANGPNRCGTDGWDEDGTASAIPVEVTQDGDQVTLTVGGLVGPILNVVVGGNQFAGQVSGSRITAALVGDNTARRGDCVYTTTVDLDATVTGDVIQGELLWRPVTNGHADCGSLETCEGNKQSFNGTRPPSE